MRLNIGEYTKEEQRESGGIMKSECLFQLPLNEPRGTTGVRKTRSADNLRIQKMP